MTATMIMGKAVLPGGPEENADELKVTHLLTLPWDGDGEMRDAADAESVRHDNTRRAGFAVAALEGYAERIGGADSEPVEQHIRDLLGDLRHLCDALGADFDELSNRGGGAYDDEIMTDAG